ncbi:hypothetical protein H0H81_009040 [Sphagnurus paluster]|uniref:homogentisate 1,2-dioxygenase n=1 Tax=Sphagnurus paluster TaxID=117069 RepID=A0A9P7GIN1_9AGAR|nr:hypothetical protein H0H81_009040 [Sphagnurus paluster]
MEKFIKVGSISKDHIDPSIFCVLTAPSKQPNIPLADLLIFGERWDVAADTFRPAYYHRNSASEFMGLVYGGYKARKDRFQPVSWEEFKAATEAELKPGRILEGTLVFMFETSMMLSITDYAINRSREHRPEIWEGLKGHFLDHLDEINKDLELAGRPALVVTREE